MIQSISLPLHEPILIFTVIISIVFLTPLFLKKLNIPDIIGLIIAGVIVGPKGFNILSGDIALSIFGTIGLLYLMFLAGLEIDLNDFFRRRKEGYVFGILTFLLPFVPGLLVFYYIFGYSIQTSLLIATMLASHTLVSYPILGRLGIINHKIVTITIAGTIIADTAVLVFLGIISDSVQGDLSITFWVKTVLFFSIFFFYVLYILPKIARWIFKYQASENSLQYIFVLTAIFISATIAEFLQIEPLIGAFFTGLSLNRLIPRTSPLMNRTVFIGNTLFIPFFLISIGMMVDTVSLISNPENWILIGVLSVLALGGKYVAAWLTKIIFGFTTEAKNLVFGLSSARAASAIAIMVVGQEFGLVSDTLLNSTVFLIMLTSIISSIATQKAGQKMVIIKNSQLKKESLEHEKIVVSLSNPNNIENLIDFSLLLKKPKSKEPLYPLSVILDGKKAGKHIERNKDILHRALERASSADKETELVTRVDVNVVDGIAHTAKELSATKILIGWNSETTNIEKLFGTLLDRLLLKTSKMLMVLKMEAQVALLGDFHVFLPKGIEREVGFQDMVVSFNHIAKHANRKLFVYGERSSIKAATILLDDNSTAFEAIESVFNEFFFKELSLSGLPKEDMFLFVKSRKLSVSYSRLMVHYPQIIKKYFCDSSLALIYPEQKVLKKGLYHIYNMN